MFNLTLDLFEYFDEYFDLISLTSTFSYVYKFRNLNTHKKIKNIYHELPFNLRLHKKSIQ